MNIIEGDIGCEWSMITGNGTSPPTVAISLGIDDNVKKKKKYIYIYIIK